MNKATVFIAAVFFILAVFPISGQVFDYRYFETPAISWNGSGIYDAGLLSLGDISLFASGPASQAANPALFPDAAGVELGFSYSHISYQSFQYWGVNEGVLVSSDPLREGLGFPSMIAARFGFPGINITAGWYRSRLNDFPDFYFRNEFDYEQYDEFSGTFSGFSEDFFIAAGFPVSGKIKAGVKVRYSRGTRKASISDKTSYYYFLDGYWQLKDKISINSESEKSEIIAPEAGMIYQLKKNWILSLGIRYPLTGKVKRNITRTLNNSDGLSIYDDHQAEDDYVEVPAVSLGLMYRKEGIRFFGSPGILRAGAQISYRKWSDYKLVYYGEEEERDLRDTVKLALGAEYNKQLKKFGLFFRIGFSLDGQPRKDADTLLTGFSTGAGVTYKGVEAGIGFLYIRGKTGGIGQNHFALCTTLSKRL